MALAISASDESEARFTYVVAWHSVVCLWIRQYMGAISAGEIPSGVTLAMPAVLGLTSICGEALLAKRRPMGKASRIHAKPMSI